MSAGAFTTVRYQADYLDGTAVHPIRVQPETTQASIAAADNLPPAGAVTNPIQARVSGSRRGIGLRARMVTLRLPSSNAPTGYQPSGIVRIPALNRAFYNAAARGAECIYLGVTCVVVGRSPEGV